MQHGARLADKYHCLECKSCQSRSGVKRNNELDITGRTTRFKWTNQICYCRFGQYAPAQGFLFMPGAPLAAHHHPVVNRDTLRCVTELWSKPVWSYKINDSFLHSSFNVKMRQLCPSDSNGPISFVSADLGSTLLLKASCLCKEWDLAAHHHPVPNSSQSQSGTKGNHDVHREWPSVPVFVFFSCENAVQL